LARSGLDGTQKSNLFTHPLNREIKLKQMCCSVKDVIEDNTVRPELRLRGAKV
jgi:hypothetical protein